MCFTGFSAKTKFTQLLDSGQHIELTLKHTRVSITFRDTTLTYFQSQQVLYYWNRLHIFTTKTESTVC